MSYIFFFQQSKWFTVSYPKLLKTNLVSSVEFLQHIDLIVLLCFVCLFPITNLRSLCCCCPMIHLALTLEILYGFGGLGADLASLGVPTLTFGTATRVLCVALSAELLKLETREVHIQRDP